GDARQVADARLGAQFVEYGVAPLLEEAADDVRVRVGVRTEDDCPCGARLLTCGDHLTIPQAASVELRGNLCAADALHAEGALLHHATLPNGDVGVLRHRYGLRDLAIVVEPVEAAYLVRAVVGAEPRPD